MGEVNCYWIVQLERVGAGECWGERQAGVLHCLASTSLSFIYLCLRIPAARCAVLRQKDGRARVPCRLTLPTRARNFHSYKPASELPDRREFHLWRGVGLPPAQPPAPRPKLARRPPPDQAAGSCHTPPHTPIRSSDIDLEAGATARYPGQGRERQRDAPEGSIRSCFLV
ncbi:hypothetical protein O3P69_002118 [Scylla paramamosain]|uniref:Uncharacterized protein n=1 Tax=Scylla paramamosain TaxID=85552 RepID=A0AAW0V778_SCYPA